MVESSLLMVIFYDNDDNDDYDGDDVLTIYGHNDYDYDLGLNVDDNVGQYDVDD